MVPDHVTLFQGDILPNCPFPVLLEIPPDDIGAGECPEVQTRLDIYDSAIILSQSCDLQPREGKDKIENVVLCPIHALMLFEKKCGCSKMRNELSRGRRIGFHLLPETPNRAFFNGDCLVVDFHNTFSVPIKLVRQLILPKGRRLRIKSPYRESLSQAFARFFMRVALPDDYDNPGKR